MKFERYYFYYVDFDGNLYHDNTLLQDKNFLNFFFRNIQYNRTGLYENYPYISPCGKEMNFITCPDTPIVFRRKENMNLIYGGDLKVALDLEKLIYVEKSGQLYYPINEVFGRIGRNTLTELSNIIIEKNNKYFINDKEIPTFHSFKNVIETLKI